MDKVHVGQIARIVKRAPGAGNRIEVGWNQSFGSRSLEGLAQEGREHLVFFPRGLDRPLSVGPVRIGVGCCFDVLDELRFVDTR